MAEPARPEDVFMHLITAVLAPMFLAVSGDIHEARLAARAAIDAYRGRNQVDLLSIAQIVAFGLTTLSSLSQSMDETLPLAMTLRLRGNATALNRAAEKCRRALRDTIAQEPPPPCQSDLYTAADLHAATLRASVAQTERRLAEPALRPATPVPAQPAPPAPTQSAPAQPAQAQPAPAQPAPAQPIDTEEHWHHAAWAADMVRMAREVTANLENLPPAERHAGAIQAAAMAAAANDLMAGIPLPPPLRQTPTCP